jgi:hypothetical protein
MQKQLRGCALLALSVLLFAGGCHKEKEPATGDPKSWEGFAGSTAPVLAGHTVKPSELSATEIRYGIAPKRGPGVTYQDSIILMEHGDKAITAFASDGMSWTFDANAPLVNEIEEGKILFATDRCAGKAQNCGQGHQLLPRTIPCQANCSNRNHCRPAQTPGSRDSQG